MSRQADKLYLQGRITLLNRQKAILQQSGAKTAVREIEKRINNIKGWIKEL